MNGQPQEPTPPQPESIAPGECPGCEHSRARHFRDVDGVVRCLVTDSGVSSSGVLGIPWRSACDCLDFHSAAADRRRELAAEKKAQHDRWMQGLLAEAQRQLNQPTGG